VSLERTRVEAEVLTQQNAELEALVLQLGEAHAELEQLKEQFREQADRDWLTGLHNRRYLARQLDGVGTDFSLAVLDLDHFKQINDTFGHEIGDQVLIRVAGLLLDVVRRSDVVARTGGEEFVLLMPASDADDAAHCCERALAAIRDHDWAAVADGLTVTCSAGIARADEALGLERVASLADRRLYDAKARGRDQVVIA
jgi:diguanylate cyclase (GGDEF)-like protein